ncbi:glycosyltransferase family 39 protein [Nitrosomonas ureae]|uniref:Dolichol-phosphate mannosyltransferase n=1 Tax=Nitrosomonas ureae TaxID=44577 RepID=A0A0S3AG88_9PROT|nr:glycosyltransferase family 39 protein [Nitrosomonas ureae]ALQ50205.1 dolichyl-phosphate beta-D-mannosyltransferase [Nitrosomonas ureae]SDT85221.1 dolichol-phosphate mannosyltransferase [Nitrosomonas ureae]SEQ00640.1 dolichol-phosphate mannosyltransferase [Nitrosomonas ureae]
MTQFSIVVPTLNESENIDLLLTRIFALDFASDSFEIIVVDDGSADGTQDKVRNWANQSSVRLIERREAPDLTASILTGVAAAKNDVIVVMDADLSHPPEQLRALVAPILENSHDVVVGSRYIAGGSTENWPLYRQFLSRVGGWIARPICDVNDVTSGFFAFRRSLAKNISSHAHGYKILLELLMANQGRIRVTEIPICFRDRTHGTSKLSLFHQQAYIQRLITLAGGTATLNTAGRFAAVGLLGVLIDAFVFHWMISREAGLALSHFVSFFIAATVNYTFNSKWAFREHHEGYLRWHQFGRFLTVGALALLLRGGVLAFLVYVWHVPPLLAIFPAIVTTAAVNYLGSAFYVFPNKKTPPSLEIRWRTAAIGIVLFAVLLRLVYFGLAQLIPDEAYYWQYAQHMDLSFYDHPPAVAWLIWLGTSVLGHNEFGVRIGALLCGLITMGYLYALAQNLYDKSTAMRTLLLLVILPLGFATGLLMIPDAPLFAAWAATLYYMERALVAHQNTAWLGMGVAFGLGLLSKYSLGLLGIAALVFVIIDPVARRWMKRPHPYLAALLALLLFSPAIIWNYQNDWISFAFQSNRVLADDYKFAVHLFILHIIVLLTPIGFLAAIYALFFIKPSESRCFEHRRHLFVQVFTGAPVLVCFILSTFDAPRFHWTAPIWLALLPTIAWMIVHTDQLSPLFKRIQSAWRLTIIACIFGYAFVLHYVVLGIPGIPYHLLTEHYFWRETAAEIEQIAAEVRNQTDKEPIIVGMSKWSVASALYFYTHGDTKLDIRSRNMFGGSGAMYEFWFPSQNPTDRPIIQVGMKRRHLESVWTDNDVEEMLDQPGAIEYRVIERHGVPVRRVYYRVSQGFKGIN